MVEEYQSMFRQLSRRMGKVEESVELTEQSYVEEWDGKHPLASSWSFWYFNRHLAKNWEDCLKKIGSFNTVEDFWSYHNHLQPPSFIKAGCDLCIFKEGILFETLLEFTQDKFVHFSGRAYRGISPMWEDAANKRGGRWDIHLDKMGFSLVNLDDYWMKLSMDLIGGRFGELDGIINGAVVNRRDKANRISLWTSVSMQRDRLTVLGKQLRSFIGLSSDHRIVFRTHQDCASNSTSQQISIRL